MCSTVVLKFMVFSRMSFSRSFLSIMLVMNFDINRSSCFMSLKSQFFLRVLVFSNVLLLFHCLHVLPGRSLHGCVRCFVCVCSIPGMTISLSVLKVSGSVLNSPSVIISTVHGPAPQTKSCLISGSFVSQGSPVGTVSSVSISLISSTL